MPTRLPPGIAHVVAAFISTMFLLIGQTIVVRKHRDRAGIDYPRAYADKAEMAASPAAYKFNCAQRAHQNTLENVPWIFTMTGVLALKHPHIAGFSLELWVISRIAYTLGYITGDPDKRANMITRVTFLPSFFILFFGSLHTTYQLMADGM